MMARIQCLIIISITQISTAWHYPCYQSFNCPKRSHIPIEEATTIRPAPDSDIVKAGFHFTFVLLFLTIVFSFFGGLFICGALCANHGGVRPLNQVSLLLGGIMYRCVIFLVIFQLLISILVTDLFMAILVIPLHLMDLLKVSSLVEEGASLTCQIRLFFHLFVICVRSWSTPSFMLLHHLHDGIIPTKHSVALITFIWIISALFVLPTVLLENSLVDFQACQLLPQNYGMVFYVVFLIFLLPSMVVTPILTRSTHMRYLPTVDYLLKPAGLCLQNNFFDYRKEFNIRRDISADFLDKEESEDEEEAEEIRVKMKISSRRNSELLHCSACSDSTLSLDRKPSQATLNFLKTDKNLPRTLFTLAISNALAWTPFFTLLTFTSFNVLWAWNLVVPYELFLGTLWLGFGQSPLTPFLIYFLSDRVYHLLNSQAKGVTVASVKRRVRKFTFSEVA